jgi:cell division cycle 20-like protein 1 (cofactor of APC complex)
LAIGTNSGEVQLWDAEKTTKIRTLVGHMGRVGAVAWNSPVFFSSGSRDKNILHRDIRESSQYVDKLAHHKQEVCGLKWSFDHQQLASGGNDNKLLVWNTFSNQPVHIFSQHNAAVKALAWSPHQHGLLVSGGGTADRTIRFWNTLNGENKMVIDAGSQVCNLMFSKTVNELVSTHGYSLNEINIWRLPKMQKVATLTGHTYRVLYLAMNPEGSTIVTGAGDETLRFWNIFPAKDTTAKSLSKSIKSQLNEDMTCLR